MTVEGYTSRNPEKADEVEPPISDDSVARIARALGLMKCDGVRSFGNLDREALFEIARSNDAEALRSQRARERAASMSHFECWKAGWCSRCKLRRDECECRDQGRRFEELDFG